MKQYSRILICTLIVISLGMVNASEVYVSPGKYNDYYHLRFALTPENCELNTSLTERQHRYANNNAYAFSEGGQFEVFIRKQAFPISAPHTSSGFLILRMPWTDPDSPDARRHIADKRALFDQILAMKSEGKGSVEVTIELNPYVTVLNHDPLKLELSGRNVFFRQAQEQYIDYVGPLKTITCSVDAPAPSTGGQYPSMDARCLTCLIHAPNNHPKTIKVTNENKNTYSISGTIFNHNLCRRYSPSACHRVH